jgi:hypothetical protein
VPSDGSYGVAEGLISSFPCTTAEGEYAIVQGCTINDFSRGKIDASVAELAEEREARPWPRPDLSISAIRPARGRSPAGRPDWSHEQLRARRPARILRMGQPAWSSSLSDSSLSRPDEQPPNPMEPGRLLGDRPGRRGPASAASANPPTTDPYQPPADRYVNPAGYDRPDPGFDPQPTPPYGSGTSATPYGDPPPAYADPPPPYGAPPPAYGSNPYEVSPYQPTYGTSSPYGVVPISHPQSTTAMIFGILGIVFGLSCGIGGLLVSPASSRAGGPGPRSTPSRVVTPDGRRRRRHRHRHDRVVIAALVVVIARHRHRRHRCLGRLLRTGRVPNAGCHRGAPGIGKNAAHEPPV